MRLEYDKQADAIYVYFTDAPYAYGKDVDNERRIDYDKAGNPIGVELLCVSEGVNTDDLPYSKQIEQLLEDHGIKVLV